MEPGGGGGSYFPYILFNEIQTMLSQLAKRLARVSPADCVLIIRASAKTIDNGFEKEHKHGALSIHPQILKILVGTSNGTYHFGLVRPEYSGPALKVVNFDRSGHFGRSDRNISFHLSKLLPPVPHFFILLTRTSSFQWKVKCCE